MLLLPREGIHCGKLILEQVEMSRVPHLVLGVFGSRAKYTLKRQLMIYELEAERLIPAQMFKM